MSLPKYNDYQNGINTTNFPYIPKLNGTNLINNMQTNQTYILNNIINTNNQNKLPYSNNQNMIYLNNNNYLLNINSMMNPQKRDFIYLEEIPFYFQKLIDNIYPKSSYVVSLELRENNSSDRAENPEKENYYNYNIKLMPPVNIDMMKTKSKKEIDNAYKEMIKRQKKVRKNLENPINPSEPKPLEEKESDENKKINRVIEDMCIYGNVVKKEIILEKQYNPGKYISIETALNSEQNEPELFAFGLISLALQCDGIETAIINDEKLSDKEKEEEDAATTCLTFMTNGLLYTKKYEFEFDLDDNRVNEILFMPKKFEEFKEMLKIKLNKDFNIPKDKIIITFPQIGSLIVQIIIQSDEYNNLNSDEFLAKFRNDDNFQELKKLKKVHEGFLMCGCRLSRRQLDPFGNRIEWPQGPEYRGGELYDPPHGWVGIGLKVFDQFENDRWIDMQNQEGEWVVAYHGLGRAMDPGQVNEVMGKIASMGFKMGGNQRHKDCDDFYHSGKKVGEGIYVTPYIRVAEEYAGFANINGKKYKIIIMVRINPKARRHCNTCEESRNYKYWVVNPTVDEIRPYRILYKKGD